MCLLHWVMILPWGTRSCPLGLPYFKRLQFNVAFWEKNDHVDSSFLHPPLFSCYRWNFPKCNSCPCRFFFPPLYNNFMLLPHLCGSLLPFLILCTLLSCPPHAYRRLLALTSIVTRGTYTQVNAKKPSSAWWGQHWQELRTPPEGLFDSNISRSKYYTTVHFQCGNSSLNIVMIFLSPQMCHLYDGLCLWGPYPISAVHAHLSPGLYRWLVDEILYLSILHGASGCSTAFIIRD